MRHDSQPTEAGFTGRTIGCEHKLLEAAWQLAEAQVKVAQRRLARVEAGEIAAAKAELQRPQAELANWEREFRRHESLTWCRR